MRKFNFNSKQNVSSHSLLSYLFEKEWISYRFAVRLVYLVWFVFGLFGVHNFILARYGLAIFQFIIASLGIAIFPWGIPLLILAGIFLLIDAFIIAPTIRYQYEQFNEQDNNSPRIINQ